MTATWEYTTVNGYRVLYMISDSTGGPGGGEGGEMSNLRNFWRRGYCMCISDFWAKRGGGTRRFLLIEKGKYV